MAYLSDSVHDDGLQYLTDNVDRFDICSAEPNTYTAATSTNTLGNKTSPTVAAPSDRSPDGREVVMSAITDGSVTGTDNASHYAWSYTAGTELCGAEALSATEAVTSGNTFTMTEHAIGKPDPT